MSRWSAVVIGLSVAAAGCGYSAGGPGPTATLPIPAPVPLAACGEFLIDGAPGDVAQASQTKQTAIRDSSGVTIDASCSTGSGLTFSASWGDGATAGTQSNPYFGTAHVYRANGNYIVALTVKDKSGATGSVTSVVPVIDFSGRWVNTSFNTTANRNETRYLDLTQGANKAISGTYTAPDGSSENLTGAINGLRGLNLRSAAGADFFYADDSGGEQLSSNGTAIRMEIGIGTSAVLILTFTRS